MPETATAAWEPPPWRLMILLGVWLLAANVFDAYHTRELLDAHGEGLGDIRVEEANPLMRRMMACGWTLVWAFKVTVPVSLAVACTFVISHPRAPLRWRRGVWYAFCGVSATYAVVVAHLIVIYLRIFLSS